MGNKSGSGWAYCHRHKEVTEQQLPKVLPSCYESAQNDGKDADDDAQGILFPVPEKEMVSKTDRQTKGRKRVKTYRFYF